jgi:ribosomal protein S18 acetylase RimI-like enzyme
VNWSAKLSENAFPMVVRDAEEADLLALAAIRQTEAHHRGRLRDARSPDFRYFVLLDSRHLIGFACLVFRRPPSWANTHDTHHLPQIVDLYIAEAQRGKGYGSQAIRIMERMVTEAGYSQIYIAVDPLHNLRAYALYQRLGYQQLQSEPYFHRWEAADGDNEIQRGDSWLVDMMKPLNT